MEKATFLIKSFYLIFVGICVYLSFRFLLPLLIPFILAYITVRFLYPVMNYLHTKCHFPKFISHCGTIILFFSTLFFIVSVLVWKIVNEAKLLLSNIPVYNELICETCTHKTMKLCRYLDKSLNLNMGTSFDFLKEQYYNTCENCSTLLQKKTGKTLITCLSSSIHLFLMFGFFIVALFILAKEYETLHNNFRNKNFYSQLHKILLKLKKGGLTYIQTEGIIFLVNWCVCSLSLFLIDNPYYFILGFIISILDAMPVLGSGTLLFPWSIFLFFQNQYLYAAILTTAYLICLFTREILEAKLLGKGMGLNPFFSLISIYIGIELFGATGIILGPIGAVLIRAIIIE